MSRLLLDTHTWVWSLYNLSNIPPMSRRAIERADTVFTSAISLYEIAQKMRLGKWPEITVDMIDEPQSGFRTVSPSPRTHRDAGLLEWSNRDPFDRMIAAMALRNDLVLVTKDKAFGSVIGLATLWS